MWNKNIVFLKTEPWGKVALKMESPLRPFRGAVNGVLDQRQRQIKTSASHFTPISPTVLELCASPVEVNKKWLFVPFHTATLSSFDPLHLSILLLSPLLSPPISHYRFTLPRSPCLHQTWNLLRLHSLHQSLPAHTLWRAPVQLTSSIYGTRSKPADTYSLIQQ